MKTTRTCPPAAALFALACLFAQAVLAGPAYSGGSGTAEDPYQIATKQDLLDLGATPDDYGKHFVLTADIDLSGETFTTAVVAPNPGAWHHGFVETPFAGTFDGNAHTIHAMVIEQDQIAMGWLGLFGQLSPGALVENLTMEGSQITINDKTFYVGTLCGYNDHGTITSCATTGTISVGDGSNYVGGICGYSAGGMISQSTFVGGIVCDNFCYYTGGVSGYSDGGTIADCRVTGTTIAVDTRTCYVGGLCGGNSYGLVERCASAATITSGTACYSLGGISGYSDFGDISSCWADVTMSLGDDSQAAGGLCGYNYDGCIVDCYATGSITAGDNTAALAGLCVSTDWGTIINCYATTAVEAGSESAFTYALCSLNGEGVCRNCYFYSMAGADTGNGTPLDVAELQDASFFAGFDFVGTSADGTDDVWAISPGHTPRLSWQEGDGPLPPSPPSTTLSGTGSADDPFRIADMADFMEFCGNSRLAAGHYFLSCDIDLSGHDFTASPVGHAFSGVFEGNGHTIRNLAFNTQGKDVDYVGLFSWNAGTIRDLGLEDARVTTGGGSWFSAAFCGSNSGTISRCYADGEVTSGDGTLGVAVLCGSNGEHGRISDCYATGSATVGSDGGRVGGLCGQNNGSITRCYTTGAVSAGNDSWHIAGFCGLLATDSEISGSYFYLFGGPANGGGEPLDAEQLQRASSFIGFDFAGNTEDGTEDTWSITPGHCPRLSWQTGDGPLPPPRPSTTLSGSGIAGDPFLIAGSADFEELCGNSRLSAGHYSLVCDLDLSGDVFTTSPINRQFGGVFDGNHHTVSNLSIHTGEDRAEYLGLFSWLSGTIRDLSVENVEIQGDGRRSNVGGICGISWGGSIGGCGTTGTVTGEYYVGGICGTSRNGAIGNSYSTVAVSGSSSSSYLGGLCGHAYSSTLANCYATGTVTGGEYLGGLCGDGRAMEKCYAVGEVIGTGGDSDYIGGLAGYAPSAGTADCYFYRLGGLDNGLGTLLDAEQLKEAASFSGFDFVGNPNDGNEEIWVIDQGRCPRLAWQTGNGPLPPASTIVTTLAGSGSAKDPFLIASKADFDEFCGNNRLSVGCYSLTCDIDLAGETFTTACVPRLFGGVLDGNGHVLRNLTIDTGEESASELGLFARVCGTVADLGLENILIAGTSNHVGGVSGTARHATFRSCYVTGSVTGGYYVGGFCGEIVGDTFANCYAAVEVTGDSASHYVGGFCGVQSSGVSESCYATGPVASASSSADLGGFCASSYDSSFSNCFWDTESSGVATSKGGTGKTTAEMQTQTTFMDAGWDFVEETANGTLDIWYMDGYPKLSRVDAETTYVLTVAGGTGSGSYVAGEHVTVVLDGTPEGQEFAAWTVAPVEYTPNLADATAPSTTFTVPATDVTITATYVAKTYVVTFDLGEHGTHASGGELSQTIDYGMGAMEPEFDVDTGWAFTGWSSAFDSVTSDLTVTAQYVQTYILTVADGTGSGSYVAGTGVTVTAAAVLLGEGFAGWTVVPEEYTGNLADASATSTTFTMPAADVMVTATYVDIPYSGGSGTAEDPYQIATKQDLLDLGATPDDYGKHFVLTADIDLSGETFTTAVVAPMVPSRAGRDVRSKRGMELAYEGTGFSGMLDGDGYLVRNLRVDMDGAPGQFVGLFGRIERGAGIADLGIFGSINGGELSYGGGLLAAENLGTIRSCFVRGSIAVGDPSSVVGGLCGNNDGTIRDCYATVTVDVGVGGMLCGGLCANNTGTIATSYSTGSVTDSPFCGGLCGDNQGTVSRCFWDTETSQMSDSAGGTGKTTAEMQTLATFTAAGWDFVGETTNDAAGTWQMADYPVLSCFALVTRHDLTVAAGTGGNSYAARSVVRVTANPASVGTTFARWTAAPTEYAANLADAAAISTTFTMPGVDVTLTPVYVPKTYTVTFDLGVHGARTGGGELVQTVTCGEAAVAPEFTVDRDWEFTGWDAALGNITSDLTVAAQYVALDADGDCLLDSWEIVRFGNLAQDRAGDPDGDGFTNWEEYVVDTDPDDDQSFPQHYPTLVWEDGVHKLRIIGKALERYMDDHGPDVLPGRLMYLVDEGYLDADMLLAIGDESDGTDPHPYLGDVYEDVSEEGVSFFYEMSEAYCPWTFIGYPHTSESTWYDIKMYQLAHGRDDGPYDRRAFPIVRLFWLVDDMPSLPNPKYRTTINLAMDCRTVFAASANTWEDQSDAYLPEGPAVLGPLPETAIVAQYGVPLSIPLWFAVKDVAEMHGLRLVASGGTRDAGIIGEIRGHYYTVTPDIDTPTAFTVTAEWDDGTGATQQASFDVALDSGPGDDPDEDGLDNTAELAAGTDPYDPESNLTVAFAVATSSVSESAGTATIRCWLSGVSMLPVTVDYAVTGGTATGGGVDYTLADGTLTFAPGAREAALELTTVDDSLPELRETVEVHLAGPTNALLGATTSCTLSIVDDDSHTVTFELGEHGTRTGGGNLTQLVAPGEAAVAPEFTIEEGWEFVGWNKDFSAVTSDLTVTAFYRVVDTDNDYLGDWWEDLHFGDLAQNRDGDPDGDGFSNWEEYVVDTDPNDPESFPQHYATLVWEDAVHKLRAIGEALERYMDDHGPDVLPGRLMNLVDEGYLDADMLLAIGDESGGTDPYPYDGDMYTDVYEEGVSFFYEMSEAYCPWTYIGYHHTPESTWYDLKMYQLENERNGVEAYDRRAFPIVRFFWPTDCTQLGLLRRIHSTSVSLSMDCHTVFASSLMWEVQSDEYLPEDPMALRPLLETPLTVQYGTPLNYPLWFALRDVSNTYGLRLVPSSDARDGEVIGEIRGHYYTVTPDIDTPTAFTVTVEWDDGTGATQQASFDVALDSGPGDDPDEDGLDNTAELAAGTDPYDPESNLTVAFAVATSSVSESAGTATIRCQLSGVSTLPVTVGYAVTGGTATGGGVDYTLASGTLTFAAGESLADLELAVAEDALPELGETIQVELYNPTNAILGSTILFTQTIVDDDPHTVTFDLGAYGTRTGGGDLSQQVAHGDAAAAPVFSVDHGWSFLGWDHEFTEVVADLTVAAQYARTTYALVVENGSGDGGYPEGTSVAVQADVASAGRYFAGWVAEPATAAGNLAEPGQASTTFSMPDHPVTLTATYGYIDPAWAVPLTLAGAAPTTLTFGMHAAATDGWDAGLDEQYPLPGPGQACLASDDLALSYSTDFHAVAETGEFLLLVSAVADTPTVVSWDSPLLPDGKYLSIYEVTLGDVAPEREAVPRGLVGNTALNMAQSSSLTVPAGETRCYTIRYGDELVFDLAFEPGWNLISLPIEPSSPALEAVLADGEVLRDGLRGTIYSGDVCTWTGYGYAAAAELHACIGYWVCVGEAQVVLVEGQPVVQTDLPLARGWNQCGVASKCPVPDDARIVGRPWAWNPRSLRYERVSVLRPGLGYWINASETASVPLATE